MADHTKFAGNSFVKYAELSDFDYILTDNELDPDKKEKLEKINPGLILC